MPFASSPLAILAVDRHFVVINKPARIGIGQDSSQDESLLEQVRAWYQAEVNAAGNKGYCVPIHFLDRPVSGAVVFALSSKAAARLNEQFRTRKIQKHYLALVHGRPPVAQGTLDDFMVKDHNQNVSRIAHAGAADAKRCRLHYETIAHGSGNSLLLVKPETGRSHQIRVQLSHMGCPIYGDQKYGSSKDWQQRIALHAWQLIFEHPTTKTPVQITAPLPAYWRAILPPSLPAAIQTEEQHV